MKKTLLILFVAVATLMSCKKDKDENKLEGRWDKTKQYSVEYENGVKSDEETEAWSLGEMYVIFEGDRFTLYEDGDIEDKGTFTMTENTITLNYDGGGSETSSFRWNSDNEFVIIVEETYPYNGRTYREVNESTFKKQ